ncbi:U-box domain-containing protein 35-like protein isoform X2 [Tanacetum coccineum]|uniref:RING-type E3 ubiquitin transferase n=1 Tax=Tanacetum coccineum TaxID=301880 RepID=A0ABQ4XGT4_9ASTR
MSSSLLFKSLDKVKKLVPKNKRKTIIVGDIDKSLTEEIHTHMKPWVDIIRENIICLGGHRDHVPACLFYMLYCIETSTPYNLAFFILKRMEKTRSKPKELLPYGMLLTRLFKHIIGEGGYGAVFKAKLDHTPVAIKVLRPDAKQGKQQFQQEVDIISRMRHLNLVLLLGACPEYGCLIYEFMNYGSLEDRLIRKNNTPSMSWHIRFSIAVGLLFLHQAKPEPLVHRDLKPRNILLDRNYVCKITDVGLARLVPSSIDDSVTQYHMTSAVGTFCYIDPEYM